MAMSGHKFVLSSLVSLLALGLSAQDNDREAAKKAKEERQQAITEALKKFRDDSAAKEEGTQIGAIQELARKALELKEEKLLDPLLAYPSKGAVNLRLAAIRALADVDHPKSVQAIGAAVSANAKETTVLRAIFDALKKLDREEGAKFLHPLLKNYQDGDVLPLVPAILDALGSMGSPDSIDPIIVVLEAADFNGTGGYNPNSGTQGAGVGQGWFRGMNNQQIANLGDPCKKALGAITNRPASGSGSEWKDWKKKDYQTFLGTLWYVHWCPDTWQRWSRYNKHKTECNFNPRHGQSDPIVKRSAKKP